MHDDLMRLAWTHLHGTEDVCYRSENVFRKVDGNKVSCGIDGRYSDTQQLDHIVVPGLRRALFSIRIALRQSQIK